MELGAGISFARSAIARDVAVLRERISTAGQEAATGRVSDPVSILGSRNAERISLSETADRLDVIRDGNALLGQRLKVAQSATGAVGAAADSLGQTLVIAIGGGVDEGFVARAGEDALTSMRQALNSRFGGIPIMAGDRTDADPIAPHDDMMTAFDAAFSNHFGFGKNDAAAASISAPDLETFLTDVATPALEGAVWDASVSNAGDPAQARIAEGVSIALGPTADAVPFRNAIAAGVVAAAMAESALNDGARKAAFDVALGGLSRASAGTAALQGEIGLSEARIEQTGERLAAHGERLRESSDSMIAVDAFEAAQRFNALATQLETAYTMTARLSQLTLLRFLP